MTSCSGKRRGKRSSSEDFVGLVLFTSSLLLVPMSVFAQMDHIHSPASAEDCTKLSSKLQAVVAAMDGSGSRVEASPKPERSPTVEPGTHKWEVALRPLSEVRLIGKKTVSQQTPGRESAAAGKVEPTENVEKLFGGFIRLTAQEDGMYRISADSTLWIEVIDEGKPIERIRVAPRLHCGRIQKSLGFPLKRERLYWLELSGSKRPDVSLLITEESEP